jgi:hypothetical protein
MTEDDELARRMRAGLERRAREADPTAPVASRARAAARRRRGARLAGLAAAAVAAVALTGVLVDRASSPGGVDQPGAVDEPSGEVDNGPWRTEYWRGLQVDVPADWGYGGAPQEGGPETVACGAVALVSATGERLPEEGPTMPYVGRPIAQTDLCEVYPWIGPNDVPAQAPYVWLGAAVAPGKVDLGDGWVQETVDVHGSRLTVATRDAGLRKRILDSAEAGETCLSEVDTRGVTLPRVSAGDAEDAQTLLVCAYRAEEAPAPGATAGLAYAARLGGSAVRDYLATFGAGPPKERCPDAHSVEAEWVVLELGDPGGRVVRRDIVHLGCPGIDVDGTSLDGSQLVELTPELVEPWAVGGVPAVLYGPTGGKGR